MHDCTFKGKLHFLSNAAHIFPYLVHIREYNDQIKSCTSVHFAQWFCTL